MSVRRRFYLNTIVPLIHQIVLMVCGFILPRLILAYYGSEVNGLVSSITQFLSIVNFFDLGVTAVLQSALYRPIALNDRRGLSEVVSSADKFFGNIGKILVGYIIVLCFIYPFISHSEFSLFYIVTLILAMGINTFGQYYLGVVDSILLTADQKTYFTHAIQASSVIVNTILCVIFIKAGASIQIVKLTTSAVYLLRPLLYRIYVKRKYDINRKIEYVGEPIKQKWNGMAQHIAAVVLTGTDTIVLTIFSTLKNVSIYNIYYLVIAAIRSLFQSLQNGIAPLLGNLWAKGEEKKVADFFAIYEWITHATTVLIFGITSSLIVPFVMIYTRGINDANYNQPLFASLLVLAYAIYSLRNPYNIMVQVAGKYRETQVAYILAAVINIVTSVAAVFALGLIGVAIGTIVSLAFQTCWMGIYVYKNLIPKDHSIIKIYVLDILISGVSIGCIKMISLEIETIAQWFIAALVYSFIWGAFSAIIWGIFERKKLQAGIRILFKKQKKA